MGIYERRTDGTVAALPSKKKATRLLKMQMPETIKIPGMFACTDGWADAGPVDHEVLKPGSIENPCQP